MIRKPLASQSDENTSTHLTFDSQHISLPPHHDEQVTIKDCDEKRRKERRLSRRPGGRIYRLGFCRRGLGTGERAARRSKRERTVRVIARETANNQMVQRWHGVPSCSRSALISFSSAWSSWSIVTPPPTQKFYIEWRNNMVDYWRSMKPVTSLTSLPCTYPPP
jgi:hypothetical protein